MKHLHQYSLHVVYICRAWQLYSYNIWSHHMSSISLSFKNNKKCLFIMSQPITNMFVIAINETVNSWRPGWNIYHCVKKILDCWLALLIITVMSHERHGVLNMGNSTVCLIVCSLWQQRKHLNPANWILWGESTGNLWIPLTKGQ